MSESTSITSSSGSNKGTNYAYRFSVGFAVLFALILLYSIYENGSFTSDFIGLTPFIICVLASIISARLSLQGKSVPGILIMISSLILLTISRVFVSKGLAISTGIINIIVIASIAIYTLPRKWISRAVTVAFLAAAVAILLDQYMEGIPATPNPEFANTVSFIVGAIFLAILIFQFPRLTLRAKLIVGFISLTALPIIILGTQTYISTRTLLEDQVKQEILRTALSANSDFQEFADNQFGIMQTQARSTDLINYINLPPQTRRGSEQESLAKEKLNSFRKNSPTYIRSYALVDLTGKSILDTNASTLGNDYSNMDFFKYVVVNRKIYASGLAVIPGETDDYVIYFAVPVLSKSGDMIGLYVRIYNANVIQSVMDQIIRTNRAPGRTTQYSYVMDATNFFVLAHTVRVDLDFKTYLSMNDPRVPALIEQGLIDAEKADTRFLAQTDTVAKLTQMQETASFLLPSPASRNEDTETAATRVTNTDWIVLASEPTSTITSLIQGQTRITVATSLVLVAMAALLALLAANFFTNPITELTNVAQSISAGDFSKRASIRTRDEIGLLADSINVMTDEIQQSIETLESRVERRTADLSQANQQSEKRAQNLQTIAEISRTISTERDQEQLLSLITKIVSDRFGFYHVGIFLLDDTNTYAVLRAANSAGGQEMLKRRHSLKVGQTGIVGYVTSTGSPRIALDTGADAVFFNNPSLPETRSEMALPLITRGTIIGALDVQSKIPNAFTAADVSIISLLADQIAIAIDNARLLEAAQASIEETQAVFNEYLAESWQKKTETGVIGYRQTTTGGQIITNANLQVLMGEADNHGKTLEVPIRVRDQTIGVLNIRPSSEEQGWSDEDMNIIEAVTERLGLALDNARLFEETSTRATRERLVADITTKIRSSNDPQEMIKTAMEELKQVLGASKVEILPKKINPSPDK
jgi:GAF domain-containing protein/HAMP domain-containing protein